MRDVTINSHGPNNDGCDPESCRDVLIEGCTFDTGDDCIALKSGRNDDGRRVNVPVENVVVRNCTMKDGHGGVVIGSEISGGARNIFAEKCRMDSPNLDRALRIKTNAVRGGVVEHVYMRDVTVGQVAEAVVTINFFYEEGDNGQVPADGARRRGAQRHEPEEPVRAAAARVPATRRSRDVRARGLQRSTTSPSPTCSRPCTGLSLTNVTVNGTLRNERIDR